GGAASRREVGDPSVQWSVQLVWSHGGTTWHDLAQPRCRRAATSSDTWHTWARPGTTWHNLARLPAASSSPAGPTISSAEFGGETGVWRGGVLECAIQCAMALVTTWHDLAQRGTTSRRWLGAAAGEPAEPTSPHLGRGRRDRGHPWWPT